MTGEYATGWWWVTWDAGYSSYYRWGAENAYDLTVISVRIRFWSDTAIVCLY